MLIAMQLLGRSNGPSLIFDASFCVCCFGWFIVLNFVKHFYFFNSRNCSIVKPWSLLALSCLLWAYLGFSHMKRLEVFLLFMDRMLVHYRSLPHNFLGFPNNLLVAFVIERFHNAVEINILGIFEEYSSLQIWPPQKIFQGRNYSGRMT